METRSGGQQFRRWSLAEKEILAARVLTNYLRTCRFAKNSIAPRAPTSIAAVLGSGAPPLISSSTSPEWL
jgi:hypothetical protein